jgi:adenine-specific DNA-methyltransferase
LLAGTSDFIIWFARDTARVKYNTLFLTKALGGEGGSKYDQLELADETRRAMTLAEKVGETPLPDGSRAFRFDNLTSPRIREARTGYYPITFNGRDYLPRVGEWKTHRDGIQKLLAAHRVESSANSLNYVRFFDDFPAFAITNVWTDISGAIQSRSDPKVYVVQTSTAMVQRCLLMTTDPGDLVLDPTCGSGTTAHVAEQWGRRWITCDTSRVALALARTRLMAAKFPYYYLADDYPQISPMAAEDEIKQQLRAKTPHPLDSSRPLPAGEVRGSDIRKGFVYKRVPHVTLKSIANNPDIREGMSRAEIEAAIARHADTETLFDQPYDDKKRVRVSGPFTVESLSPHRTISVEEKKRYAESGTDSGWKVKVVGPSDFAQMIIENLRKAGVQNTVKNERLKFDTLNPYAGEWIHAEGWYTEQSPLPNPPRRGEGAGNEKQKGEGAGSGGSGEGVRRRAAICIGPEHGTVGAQLIKEAAKEAVKGVGFDILIVCGFAFDPSVSEEAKRYGKLTVLPARMNPDLAMGDELLKKTGAGNLFMVFGEPDIEIRRIRPQMTQISADKNNSKKHLRTSAKSADNESDEEMIQVRINGLDVYDPTTGEIRSSSTDDIACWFIDTQYNGESFFVRHAYFTGADEPYEKLKRALRAEIDEAAWSSLYSTTSRPFDRPETGKIAVKVINHYGDEVLKVYDV